MEKVLGFLKELSENNNREWFNDNRKWYEESKEKILFLTDVLINEIGAFDPAVRGLVPKDCIFRIFRDVRFSKDKRPYKTNFGSFICKGGRKSMNPGYYFHIEPGGCFVAAGIYMPPSPVLKMVRNYLADHGDEFLGIINDTDFKKQFPEMFDDKLKLAPKGFPKDHEYIELLKYKSFIYSKELDEQQITGENSIEELVWFYRQMYPFNAFLYEALAY